MMAVLQHELKSYFHTLTAYVFGAFLLCFVGIGAMMYNLNAAVSNFEYVLSFGSMVFVVIVPILTMRVIAEERKQKTDQLLYSLPISTTQVVLGKYLALLAVYLVPLCIISVYPLIFSRYGEVYLPTSYGSILAFFVLGVTIDTGNDGQMVWFSSSKFLEDGYNTYSSGANLDLTMNALADLIGEREAIAIRSKSLDYNFLTISDSVASLLKTLMIGVFPLVYLGVGIVVMVRRKQVQHEAV